MSPSSVSTPARPDPGAVADADGQPGPAERIHSTAVGPPPAEDAALPATPERLAPAIPAQGGGWRPVLAILVRFVTCGALGVGGGFAWRFTVAPHHLGVGNSLAGVISFLIGFMVGGLAWFASDVRRRRRDPQALSDERFVFSVVVFAAIPLTVLVLVAALWVLTLLIA